MSLADLVPVAVASNFGALPRDGRGRFAPNPRRLTNAERCRRWRHTHREAYNAYRNAWNAKRRAKGSQ